MGFERRNVGVAPHFFFEETAVPVYFDSISKIRFQYS